MSWNSGAAASYLGSFRPVGPVPGFSDVLSTDGVNTFKDVAQQNALIESGLASKALGELGANRRTEMTIDGNLEAALLNQRANRRAGALRLAGEMLASALPGSQGSAGVEIGDPLALIERLQQFSQNQANNRARQTLRSNTYAKGLIGGLG